MFSVNSGRRSAIISLLRNLSATPDRSLRFIIGAMARITGSSIGNDALDLAGLFDLCKD